MIYILGFAVLAVFMCYACCAVASDADDASERYYNERQNRSKN